LIWTKTEETNKVEKNFTNVIEAHAARKKVAHFYWKNFEISETTMDQKTYLIVALGHASPLSTLEIERNEDLGMFLYKGINNVFKDKFFKSSLQKIIVEKVYRHWTNMAEAKKSTAQLIITGHSTGGGLAQILGAYLKSQTENLLSNLKLESDKADFATMLKQGKVYTFSTPFVFLKKL
jgi:hypothetical protein